MVLARHCALCDHQKVSLEIGTTCGLNDKKPEFNRTCIKISLTDKFENKLKSVNVEYERLKRKKFLTYTYFVMMVIVGVSVSVGGFLIGKYVYDNHVFSKTPLIIMIVGLTPLGMGIGTLNRYRQDVDLAKYSKDQVDEVLKEYRIEYEIDMKFEKEIHGSQDVFVELKTKGIR